MFVYETTPEGKYTVLTGHGGIEVVTRPTVRAALTDCHTLYKAGIGHAVTPAGTEIHLPTETVISHNHTAALEILAEAAHTYLKEIS